MPLIRHLTRSEAAALIEAFVNGTLAGEFDWDDFCTLPAGCPEVEQARIRCLRLPDEFPRLPGSRAYCGAPGIEVLVQIVRELRDVPK